MYWNYYKIMKNLWSSYFMQQYRDRKIYLKLFLLCWQFGRIMNAIFLRFVYFSIFWGEGARMPLFFGIIADEVTKNNNIFIVLVHSIQWHGIPNNLLLQDFCFKSISVYNRENNSFSHIHSNPVDRNRFSSIWKNYV